MNRKAIELAISTLILIILGVLILIAIIYAVTDGFKNFNSTTEPFTDVARETAIKTACQDACSNQLKFTYCCEEYFINSEEITCQDTRLGITCDVICEEDFCESIGTKCDWLPNKDYGECKMLIGSYYDGEKCVSLGGCERDNDIPFASLASCQSTCE